VIRARAVFPSPVVVRNRDDMGRRRRSIRPTWCGPWWRSSSGSDAPNRGRSSATTTSGAGNVANPARHKSTSSGRLRELPGQRRCWVLLPAATSSLPGLSDIEVMSTSAANASYPPAPGWRTARCRPAGRGLHRPNGGAWYRECTTYRRSSPCRGSADDRHRSESPDTP
jgi:hypothetical protein